MGNRLRTQARWVGNLGRTCHEKTEQIKNTAHCSLLNVAVLSCLESICRGPPRLRSNSRELLDTPGHVRLVGETKLGRNTCERRLSITNELQCTASTSARTEGLG